MVEYLDKDGLIYFWGKIVNFIRTYFVIKESGKGLSTNDFSNSYKDKLDNIKPGAEPNVQADWNQSDANSEDYIRNKPTFKDINGQSIIMDGQGSEQINIPVYDNEEEQYGGTTKSVVTTGEKYHWNRKIDNVEKGSANGVAPLDSNGKIDSQYLPSYVDDVIEAYPVSGATKLTAGWLSKTNGGAALTPETGKIYILMTDYSETVNSTSVVVYAANTEFRWSGTTYVKINDGGVTAITNAEIDTIISSAIS